MPGFRYKLPNLEQHRPMDINPGINFIQGQKWSCALEKTQDFELDLVYYNS